MNAQHNRERFSRVQHRAFKLDIDSLEAVIDNHNEHGIECTDWNEYTNFVVPWKFLDGAVYMGLQPIWERDGVVCSDLVNLEE